MRYYWRIFCGLRICYRKPQAAKNQAFRSKSSPETGYGLSASILCAPRADCVPQKLFTKSYGYFVCYYPQTAAQSFERLIGHA